jgi:hypothetical protein
MLSVEVVVVVPDRTRSVVVAGALCLRVRSLPWGECLLPYVSSFYFPPLRPFTLTPIFGLHSSGWIRPLPR